MNMALVTIDGEIILIPLVRMKIKFSSIPKFNTIKEYENYFITVVLKDYQFEEVMFSNELESRFLK